jgi:hypothetical protein
MWHRCICANKTATERPKAMRAIKAALNHLVHHTTVINSKVLIGNVVVVE